MSDVRLVLVTATSTEPVTRTEAKDWLKINSTDTAEDTMIDGLLATARQRLEERSRRSFLNQVYDAVWDTFPCGNEPLTLPVAPLVSITSIKGFTDTDPDNAGGTAMSSSDYYLDTMSEPGRVLPINGATYPVATRVANAAIVRFTAGYSSARSDVPDRVKTAIKTYVAYLYMNRGDEQRMAEVPDEITEVLGDLNLPEYG